MLIIQRGGDGLARAKSGELMPRGGDISDELRILRQVAAEDLLKRKQRRYALSLIAGGNEVVYFIGQRIANINDGSGVIHAANIAHPASDAQRQ